MRGFRSCADGGFHAVVDLDLEVEELGSFGFRLCQFVEEIVEEEEVIEEVAEGKGGGGQLWPGGWW